MDPQLSGPYYPEGHFGLGITRSAIENVLFWLSASPWTFTYPVKCLARAVQIIKGPVFHSTI